MGFNKTFLRTVEDIEKRLESDRESTLRWLKKSDCFIGPSETIDFVNQLLKEEYEREKAEKANQKI